MADIISTVVGNLVKDQELRFTPQGKAVCSITIACSSRRKDAKTGEWVDGDTTFVNATAWDKYAENIAESFVKGNNVIALGRFKQRSYENKEGAKVTVMDFEITDIGATTRYATYRVTKLAKQADNHFVQAVDPWAKETGTQTEAPF
jgi:single-strand DNA-binding protein